MIQTTEPIQRDHQDRHLHQRRQIGHEEIPSNRNEPSADTFDDDGVEALFKCAQFFDQLVFSISTPTAKPRRRRLVFSIADFHRSSALAARRQQTQGVIPTPQQIASSRHIAAPPRGRRREHSGRCFPAPYPAVRNKLIGSSRSALTRGRFPIARLTSRFLNRRSLFIIWRPHAARSRALQSFASSTEIFQAILAAQPFLARRSGAALNRRRCPPVADTRMFSKTIRIRNASIRPSAVA